MVILAPQVRALEMQLAGFDHDFICLTPLPAARVMLRFLGPFQGQTVVWEMRLTTLADCRQSAGENDAFPCPFIEIAKGKEGVHPITVALDLPIIDEPVIRKTMIMVRNYKRLKIGRIEFCPVVAVG